MFLFGTRLCHQAESNRDRYLHRLLRSLRRWYSLLPLFRGSWRPVLQWGACGFLVDTAGAVAHLRL